MCRTWSQRLAFGVLLLVGVLGASCGGGGAGPMLPPAQATPEPLYTLPAPRGTSAATPLAPSSPTPPPSGVAAVVNGEAIPLDAYEKQVAQFEAALRAQGVDPSTAEGRERLREMREQVLEAMIDQVLIAQGAAELGISIPEEEVQAYVERSIAEGGGRERFVLWLEANHLTEEEFRENVHAQLLTDVLIQHLAASLPQTAPQVHLRQILVSDENLAWQLQERLARGESFGALAKEFSEDQSTREQGGDLGWFPQGLSLLPPEVEAAAFALEPGAVSEVVRTAYGYYVLVQVVEKDPNRALSLEMQQALRQQRFLEWLDAQRAKATIVRP